MTLRCRWIFAAVVLTVLAFARASNAQDTPPAKPKVELPKLELEAINSVSVSDAQAIETGLGQDLALTFVEEPALKGPLVLFLNDAPVTDLQVLRSLQKPRTLIVQLRRTAANDVAWRRLLGGYLGGRDDVAVAAGLADQSVVTPGVPCRLKFRASARAMAFSFTLMALYLLVSVLGIRGGMLNDAGRGSSFSLGRVQMFVWTSLIIGSFLIIWAVTGAADTITSQSLVLMGISASTALGAVLVDSSKRQAALQAVAQAGAQGAPDGSKAAIASSLYKPQSFFADLLQDGNGWSLHRVQIFVWTLVLAALFVIGVYRDLAMPQFSETLLALMAVSGGVYVGFKLPEA